MELSTLQPDERILLWPELAAIVPLSRVTSWKLRQKGLFPKPVKLSTKRVGWRLSDIREWIATRDAA